MDKVTEKMGPEAHRNLTCVSPGAMAQALLTRCPGNSMELNDLKKKKKKSINCTWTPFRNYMFLHFPSQLLN